MPKTAPEWEALIEETPAMLWRGDHEGRCVFLNRAQRDFWGVADPVLDQFDWSSTLLPEDREKVFGPFQEGMAAQQPFTCEARYRRADGAVRILRTKATPWFGSNGTFRGMIGVNEDVTDLREAQSHLDRRNQDLASSLRRASAITSRFELATQISGLAMSEHDTELRYTWVHNLPEEFLGRTPADIAGEEIGAKLEAILRDVLESGEPAATEIEFVHEGQRHWWEIQACRIVAEADEPRIIASALNTTARRTNEAKLELLAHELAHRVKNIYSVTQAIVHQSARASDVPPEFVRSVSDRLSTLARAQDALLANSDDRVSIKTVVEANLAHLSRVEILGDGATVPGRSAPYLALAVHELGTNALKYGALAHEDGTVQLSWHEDSEGSAHIVWSESSPVPPPPSETEGFGTALLTRIFTAATGGQVQRELTRAGLRWTAVLPAESEFLEEAKPS